MHATSYHSEFQSHTRPLQASSDGIDLNLEGATARSDASHDTRVAANEISPAALLPIWSVLKYAKTGSILTAFVTIPIYPDLSPETSYLSWIID